jgi:hypothetical protein
LDRRGARRAWNPGQAFEASPAARDGAFNHGFPRHPGAYIDDAVVAKLDIGDPDVDDETVVAFVGHDQIRAATEDRGGHALISGPPKHVDQ